MPRYAPRAWFAVILAGWLAGGASGSPLAAGEAGSTSEAPAVHRVVIERFRFTPAEIEIRPGEVVEWINLDLAPHTASARDGAWDSGELPRGSVFRRAFTTVGSFDYFCAFHPRMLGTVTVTAP